MVQDDKKRQIDWLMDEIKQFSGPKQRKNFIIQNVFYILMVLGVCGYVYLGNHDNSLLFFCAVLVGIILCSTMTTWYRYKRIERADSPEEILSAARIMNICDWMVLLTGFAVYYIVSGDSLGKMIWFTVILGIMTVNRKLFNKTDPEVAIERLKELMKEGE